MRKGRLSEQRRELVIQHRTLASKLAKQFFRERGFRWAEWDDVESAAMLGLCEAARGFDPSRAQSFTTYAYIRIRGEMFDMLRRAGVPRPRKEVAEENTTGDEEREDSAQHTTDGACSPRATSKDAPTEGRKEADPRSCRRRRPLPFRAGSARSAPELDASEWRSGAQELHRSYLEHPCGLAGAESDDDGPLKPPFSMYSGRIADRARGELTCRLRMNEADVFDFLGIDCTLVDLSEDPPVSYARQESPEAIVLKRLVLRRAMGAFRALPERQQEILRLHYQEEMSYEDMRIRFGDSSRSWLCRLHLRSLDALRLALEQAPTEAESVTSHEIPRAA